MPSNTIQVAVLSNVNSFKRAMKVVIEPVDKDDCKFTKNLNKKKKKKRKHKKAQKEKKKSCQEYLQADENLLQK